MPSSRAITRRQLVDEAVDDREGPGRFARAFAVVRRRPRDTLAIAAVSCAVAAIVTNALYLQPLAHPAPLFPVQPRPVVDSTGSVPPVLPRPRPPGNLIQAGLSPPPTARPRTAIVMDIQRELARRGFFDGPADGMHGPRTDTAIRDFAQTAGVKLSGEPDEAMLRTIAASSVKAPPANPPVAPPPLPPGKTAKRPGAPLSAGAPSKRVLAVQRALSDFGYGQIAPTGVQDADTKTAIERFERERKLPITGQISDRLTRELASLTGRPLD